MTSGEPTGAPDRPDVARRWVWVALAVLTVSHLPGAWQDFTLAKPYHQGDFGNILQASVRLLDGQIPYRDYLLIWPPLAPLVLALSFALLGPSLWAAKVPLVLFAAARVPLTYLWLRQIANRSAALAGAAAVWALAPADLRLPYTMGFTVAPALLAFLQLGRMRPHRLIGPAWWAGCSCGIALGFKHNIGVLVGLAIWTWLLCLTPYAALAPRPNARPNARVAGGIRLGATVVALASLLYLCLQFPTPVRTPVILLTPAAVLTGAGAWAAWRRDREDGVAIDWRALGTAVAAVAAGVAVSVLPWVLWLAHNDALPAFAASGLLPGARSGADWGRLYGTLMAPVPLAWSALVMAAAAGCTAAAVAARHATHARAWTAGALLLAVGWQSFGNASLQGMAYLPPLLLLLAAFLRPATEERHRRILAMAACAAWFLVVAYPGPSVDHQAKAVAPVLALGVALAWQLTGARHRVGRIAVVALLAGLVLYPWAEWWNVLHRDAATQEPGPRLVRIAGPRGGTWAPGTVARELADTVDYLDRAAPPGAPLVAWPGLGMVNFLSARPNPTAMDYYWPGYMDGAMEQRLLDELRASRPPVIIMSTMNDFIFGSGLLITGAPRLITYIETHYAEARQFPHWTVLTRNDLAPAADPVAGDG